MYSVEKITYKETYPIRQVILRVGKPLEDCFFDGDNLESTDHFGLLIANEIISVVSVFKNKNESFIENCQYQLRGMAVLTTYQSKGVGKKLLLEVEKAISQQNAEPLVWCNARKSAAAFYEKMGYKIDGNPFEIEGVGTHYVMYKKLF